MYLRCKKIDYARIYVCTSNRDCILLLSSSSSPNRYASNILTVYVLQYAWVHNIDSQMDRMDVKQTVRFSFIRDDVIFLNDIFDTVNLTKKTTFIKCVFWRMFRRFKRRSNTVYIERYR